MASLDEQLTAYLSDAHAIEEQALPQMRAAPDLAGDPELTAIFRTHLTETERHEQLTREWLEARGGSPSRLKDAAMRLGALNWGAFFAAQPDTPGKLAAFAYAFEFLEVGGYEQLKRVARRAGDQETERLAERILAEERAMADGVAAASIARSTRRSRPRRSMREAPRLRRRPARGPARPRA